MLFRLNFLVTVVCLAMNTPYMLYYICPMHTVWFLSVYAMMAVKPSLNETTRGLAIKFGVYAVIVALVWEIPGACAVVFKPLYYLFRLKDDSAGEMHEWVFRSGLDHWATFCGMLCAAVFPWVIQQTLALEKAHGEWRSLLYKGPVVAGFTALLVPWYHHVFSLDKFTYNTVHTYFAWLPILAYIMWRNLFPATRAWYLRGFGQAGLITLETYLCQYHIWMARHNDKPVEAVLTIIPGYPLLNFALNTAVYLYVSQTLFDLTTVFSAYLLPPSDTAAMKTRWAVLGGLVGLGSLAVYGVQTMVGS